jgi:hypothetical protein
MCWRTVGKRANASKTQMACLFGGRHSTPTHQEYLFIDFEFVCTRLVSLFQFQVLPYHTSLPSAIVTRTLSTGAVSTGIRYSILPFFLSFLTAQFLFSAASVCVLNHMFPMPSLGC